MIWRQNFTKKMFRVTLTTPIIGGRLLSQSYTSPDLSPYPVYKIQHL